jgi:hypothetical protein
MKRVAESAGDIRDGRGDASHRQLLKDIENANVLTGGCVFQSQWDIYLDPGTMPPLASSQSCSAGV